MTARWSKYTGALLVLLLACARPCMAEKAPGFTLNSLDGKPVTLSAQRGKVVFLDFWATWCPPCRRSIPAVEELFGKFSGRGAVFLGINTENDPEAVSRFVKKQGIKYTVLMDDRKTSQAYRVRGIPAFFIVSPQGEIVKSFTGYSPGMEREWETLIERLLNESGRTQTKPGSPPKK